MPFGEQAYVDWLVNNRDHSTNSRKRTLGEVLKKEVQYMVRAILRGQDTFDTAHFGQKLSCERTMALLLIELEKRGE